VASIVEKTRGHPIREMGRGSLRLRGTRMKFGLTQKLLGGFALALLPAAVIAVVAEALGTAARFKLA